ncbi:hypothetical protein GCM10027299_31510 [Larkinella ripae]
MKKIITLVLTVFAFPVCGTHLLGGYIQVKRTSASLTFEFTVNIYTNEVSGQNATSQADFVTLCTGDGSGTIQAFRQSRTPLDRLTALNRYQVTHTYNGTGSGTYTVSTQLPNRSPLANLPDALTQPLYLETTFSTTLTNSLPVFQGPTPASLIVPVNERATYNLRATETDGDSVAHYLVRIRKAECQQSSQPLANYVFPNEVTRRGAFKIDAESGQLTWDAPTQTGLYDFAVVAEEWRNGQRISTTLFDLVTQVIDKPGSTPGTIPPYEPVLERGLLTAVNERVDEEDLNLTVFPSPSQTRFQVLLKSQKPTTATFQLLDSQGKLIQEVTANTPAREHQQHLGTDQLAPGLYLIRTSARGRTFTNKVLKK